MSKNTQNNKTDVTNVTLSDKKKKFLEILEENNFNVSETCKLNNISRQTYYRWLKDEKFSQLANDLKEVETDGVESALHKLINAGNPAAIIFYLKTKGKNRGYIEKQEFEVIKPISEINFDEL